MTYTPSPARYDSMQYRRCGRSGLKLPAISLGLWHNFGHDTAPERSRRLMTTAFDLGITHFDLANNYGPPPGSAEEFFGSVMTSDFKPFSSPPRRGGECGTGRMAIWEAASICSPASTRA